MSVGLGCQKSRALSLSFLISALHFPTCKSGIGCFQTFTWTASQEPAQVHLLSGFFFSFLLLPHLLLGVIAGRNLYHSGKMTTKINILNNITYSTKTLAIDIFEFQQQLEAHCTLLPCWSLKFRLIPHEINCLYTPTLCPHALPWINIGQSGLYAKVVFLLKDDP